eukprot:1157613-Pelagomonas_calceolata.AAC.2
MKRAILQYRTCTLYNLKHAVCFKRTTNPLCPLSGCHQLDSAFHMLLGCQNHIISSMKTERHNVSGKMIFKALSKSPWGAGLVDTDIVSDGRLAQHNLKIPAHVSNRIITPYLFPHTFPKKSRLTFSRPDGILVTPYNAKLTPPSSSSSSSHHVLCSRLSTPHRPNTTTCVRQPHQLSVNQQHVHFKLIEIKCCKDSRPGQQLEKAQRQHADLRKSSSAKVVTLHSILLGVGGTYYTEHTLNQFKQLVELDHQRAI